jgi:predicted  nucleic acid-binding Zn-ribbon protein
MNCFNCGTPYQEIEQEAIMGVLLTIGYRCPVCGDEYWPYDQETPPEVEIVEDIMDEPDYEDSADDR